MGCLQFTSVLIGLAWTLVSLAGIGGTIFLIFGDPFQGRTVGTYTPNWEDIGPALFCSLISLLVNIILIGGAIQKSHRMVLTWLIWTVVLIALFWLWFGYNEMKHQGYLHWYGMKGCYFCGLVPEESYVSSGGAIGSFLLLICMIPVAFLHSRLRKLYRQLRHPEYQIGSQQLQPIPHSYFEEPYQMQQKPFMEYRY